MRSYYAHLETATGKSISSKPVFRSSAIFPVMQQRGISSRILFMGYWILKRHIKQITAVISLRTQEGTLLNRTLLSINEAKTYRIELSEQLVSAGLAPDAHFYGSLEIEFFSTVTLVFPFPAVAINYYGPAFCSVVHTAQRVYNDFDDMHTNMQTVVPESGFNIYAEEDREPFLGLINGPEEVLITTLTFDFFNTLGESVTHKVHMDRIAAYQTQFIYPARLFDLKSFLKGEVGSGKVHFNVNWIFPRLVVGNIQKQAPAAVTITHTYYDCSEAKSESDWWLPTQPEWYPAALMVPTRIQEHEFTHLYFYPIYSPSTFVIDIEVYDDKGGLLGRKENVLTISSQSKKLELQKIDLNALCKEMKISPTQPLATRLLARTLGNHRLPARVKLALDMGYDTLPHMPCNICTNLQPFNPELENKPTTFRWFPFLADQPDASVWILSSSPKVNFVKEAMITLTFYREQDVATLMRTLQLPPHGFLMLRLNEDEELKAFFGGVVGWCTVVSTNPYLSTYYLAANPSGVVGGDHGF
ncbi:MAG: hypothetical protein H0X51_04475 [Parachlamydiaceae bacterium]|nr:hypothetical protein [Parachlamydiaceae bacterium]